MVDSVTYPDRNKPGGYDLYSELLCHFIVVEVYFDLLPTSMRFNAPAYPCMVMENDIQYCNGFRETYDPRLDPKAKETSFETAFDDFNEYSRMWVESQNDARIVVRVRGALVSDEGRRIAHADIPSGSPHGEGDWVDEWYYIYPDGVHARHVKIYTGLASRGIPFGYDREPPRVIHDFMEAIVLGKKGHIPQEDIESECVTLIKTVGEFSEDILAGGKSKTFSFTPYPRDFGEFSSANIIVVNLKSRYKPFMIAMPYGIRTQPYQRDDQRGNGVKSPAGKAASGTPEVVLPAWAELRQPDGKGAVAISGELKQWHKVTLTLDGPFAAGLNNDPNPYTDYNLMVTFTHESGSPRHTVPGCFAADGNAGETSATAGTKWRAHLSPDKTGKWNYSVALSKGKDAALDGGGTALKPFDGQGGSFSVAATDKTGRDFRGQGRLQYVDKHHLQFAGSKQYFLKAGADAPETFLAYVDFDGTSARKPKAPLKTWAPHVKDWTPGSPTWKNGKGKGIIGALNYLAGGGVNALSFLTCSAGGAGVEYYFGYKLPQNDLVCQDYRSRDPSWGFARIALEVFPANKIPFWEMKNANALVGNVKNDNSRYCLAKAGEVYLVFLPSGGTTELDLAAASGAFTVRWFNPRHGGSLQTGSVKSVNGGGKAALGNPPADPAQDWLIVVCKQLRGHSDMESE